jgi:dCMP deaminase
MAMAEVAASRSHDTETKVGSILVKADTGAVIATGCNGFVRGADDTNLPTHRPEKYDYIVHSEMNLIANCARHGVSTDNCFVVCTLTPCKICMRMLWQCGISRVIAKSKYRDLDEILAMTDLAVDIRSEEGFVDLIYRGRTNG